MIDQTDYVVYGEVIRKSIEGKTINEFRVIEGLKGNLEGQKIINIEEYGFRSGDLIAKVTGDVSFEIGKRYLLFLWKTNQGNYKTSLMALSVYEEGLKNSKTILAHPYQMQQECFVGSLVHELSGAYEKQLMLDQINSIVRSPRPWNKFDSGFIDAPKPIIKKDSNSIKDHKSFCPNTPPSHCTTLFGSPSNLSSSCQFGVSPAKFESPNFTVKVASGAQDDPSTSTEMISLNNAINTLDGLPGISVASPLEQECIISVSSCPVAGLAQICNSDPNEIWVFFNDPCDEITDLSGCSGTLGIGGSFASSQCHTDPCGNQWSNSLIPYFVMNNGAGCLSDYEYTGTLIHEMMHGLGLGHIGSGMACDAIMNPTVCNANESNNAPNYGITNLDEQCIDWMYNIGNSSCAISNLSLTSGPSCNGNNVDFTLQFTQSITSGSYTVTLGQTNLGRISGTTASFTVPANQGNQLLKVADATENTCFDDLMISIPSCFSCTDGIQNGDESGIDCGGTTCPPCDCTDDDDLTFVSDIPNGTDEYVNDWIKTQGTVEIDNGFTVELRAGSFIELMPGFEIKTSNSGSVLIAIEDCNP